MMSRTRFTCYGLAMALVVGLVLVMTLRSTAGSKDQLTTDDWHLIKLLEDQRCTAKISLRDSNDQMISAPLSKAVLSDLKTMIAGRRSDLDPIGLRTSYPSGIIEISGATGTHRLEWHVGIIVDPRGDESHIWNGRGAIAMTEYSLDHDPQVDQQFVEALVVAWEKAIPQE